MKHDARPVSCWLTWTMGFVLVAVSAEVAVTVRVVVVVVSEPPR